MIRTLLSSCVLFAVTAGPASASAPSAPSLKPPRAYASDVVSTQDAAALHRALAAAERGDWRAAERHQADARDPLVADLILWRRATAGPPGMGFEQIANAYDRLANWPSSGRIRTRAEDLIDDSALSFPQRINWFGRHGGAVTGSGKLAYAIALWRSGERETAETEIRDAWQGYVLDRDETEQALALFGDVLTTADHEARADYLLWTGQRSAAQRLKPRLSDGWQRLVDARIALASRSSGVDAMIERVPDTLQDNPGLLYERARWRRQRGNASGATPLLTEIDGNAVPEGGRGQLWDERSRAYRRALEERAYSTAYALTAPHGLTGGVDFAEAEFAAGWTALRWLDQADTAANHFSSLSQGVVTPISRARADYWLGRSREALADREGARAAYEAAAAHNFVFYGQLAAEQVSRTQLRFDAGAQPTAADRSAFEARPLVKALRLLGEAGETRLFRQFAYHLDDQLERDVDYLLLSELATAYQVPDVGVRGAKAGMARGILSPDAAYPIVDYPLMREPQVERSLMLALSRQESEMNPRAVSYAGALGLMQFMPATAAQEARQRGLPYRKSWLTDDPGYNMTLGGAHLDSLLSEFNGSYVMTAAAYNAGASRPRQWVRTYGDPRLGEIDPIDWIELIPFSQTRDYVQRVVENTQVYRHRLTGEQVEIRTSEDIERGRIR